MVPVQAQRPAVSQALYMRGYPMALTDSFQGVLERTVAPLAHKLSENNVLQGLTQGFMATMPVTLGVALLSIISGLPIEPLQTFLTSTGLGTLISNALAVTMNLQALYLAAAISYSYSRIRGLEGMTPIVLTLATMLIMIPLNSQEIAPGYSQSFIPQSYLGSNGIFIAIVFGILVPLFLDILLKHVSIKLPDSVPLFVSRSLSPTFAAIIILTGAVLLAWGVSFTPFGNIYDLVSQTIAAPIMGIGASPIAYAVVVSFAQFVWFFGVHPSSIISAYSVILTPVLIQNSEAFAAGAALPALHLAVMYAMQNADSLAIGICAFFTKSERYKSLGRIAIIPSIFNITEPLMFGVPLVMNPTFFIPFVLAKPLICAISTLGYLIGLGGALNPMVSLPFALPQFITTFLQGGLGLLAINLACILVMVLLFMPFFRMADKQALAEEAAATSDAA